jgi:D-sedoheptulose 7-phosphate isomerase
LARALGGKVLALTGEGGGKLAALADVTVRVPAKETYKIQEYHLPVYHALCAAVESALFD